MSGASSSSSAACTPATPNTACSVPTTTPATASPSAARSPMRATCRHRVSVMTSAAATRRLAQGLPFDGKASEGEMDSPPVLFETGTELGDAYIEAMELAGEYAYAGRDVVVAKVLEILGAEAIHEVHNHHNFAWREEHGGRTYWVIRKGCTPARPRQEGFVGGSMGDESVILEGVESGEAEESLFSTVHGAGRIMSRTQAAGRVRRRKRWACSNRDCDRLFESPDGGCPEHPGSRMMKTW